MLWQTRTHTFDFAGRGAVMGIINVTADSFSDGGQFLDAERAVAHAREMVAQGAEIIDVGGESTRPGAEPVPEAAELARVLPVVRRLAEMRAGRGMQNDRPQGEMRASAASPDRALRIPAISIDTMKPAVARAAIEAGADIINDVTGLRDPAMREVVRDTGAGAIAMHMQGMPRDMQTAPHYEDVVAEIRLFFRQTLEACLRSGIDPMRLAFDPGIGFGKTLDHNLALLRNLDSMRVGERPLVLGVSRKSFIGKALGLLAMEDRAWPTVALTSYGRSRGASVFRVHEVRPNVEALRMTEALLLPAA
jgi:dihydropteroate synthase